MCQPPVNDRRPGARLRPECPPPGHDTHQALAREDAQHSRDCGLADAVVLSQRGDGRQRLAAAPLSGRDATSQVVSDDLRWPLWSTWHILIIPAGDRPARPGRLHSLESAGSPVLLWSRLSTPQRPRTVLPHRYPGPDRDGASAMTDHPVQPPSTPAPADDLLEHARQLVTDLVEIF